MTDEKRPYTVTGDVVPSALPETIEPVKVEEVKKEDKENGEETK